MGQASANNSDINRRIESIVRAGTVTQVDHGAARCRVKSGGLQTDWLPWISLRAGDIRHWSPPSVGEQCIVFAPGGNMASAFVLVGIFSNAAPANANSPTLERTTYPDGAVIEYDHAAHALRVALPAGATADVTVPGSVNLHTHHLTLDAPETLVLGNMTVSGDVVASGVSLVHHVHGGVSPGGALTGEPA